MASSLEMYAAIMAYVAVSVGLMTSDYLAIEGGLKAAVVSMFIGAIRCGQGGGYASAISLAVMASVIVVLFYLIGLPGSLASAVSYLLLAVLATAASRVGAGGSLSALLVRGIPTFYAASAYAFLTRPWDSFQNGLKIFFACSILFALLSVLTSLETTRRPLVKGLLYITTKHVKTLRRVSRVFKSFYSRRDLASAIRTLSAIGKVHQLAVSVLASGYRKVVVCVGAISAVSDRVILSVSERILYLTRSLEATSRGLEVSLGAVVSRISHGLEMLQNSLESSLLLLLSAMSVLVLIAVAAYVLLLA